MLFVRVQIHWDQPSQPACGVAAASAVDERLVTSWAKMIMGTTQTMIGDQFCNKR
jgi:hypothetical protein